MGNQPLWKSGDVAVWPPRDAGQHQIFTVSDGKQGGDKLYTSVFSKVAGAEITPEEAGRLYMGEELEMNLPARGGGEDYSAIVLKKGIKTEVKNGNDGRRFENRTLELGIVIPMRKREGNELFGYKVGGVAFFKSVGPKDKPIELSAGDVLTLSAGRPVEKDGNTITVTEIQEGERGKNARVLVVPQKVVSEEDDIDLGMPDIEEEHGQGSAPRV